ncbi:MAG TPA: carboxypeptidase-like regulatory domain-containing protein, partial [Candidatus Marinimicrobia bacterium]|nr:carboxypeptidase-like regulatory domain-containing protein [Candidatus Neomarinimicrobiota bacterium]
MKMKIFKYLAVLIIFLGTIYAGTDGTIRGQVKNIEGASMPGAQIFVPELAMGAIADENGKYIILN